MKNLVTTILSTFLFLSSFSQVPDTTGPFRGLENWNNQWQVPYPSNSSTQTGNVYDFYYRFSYRDLVDDNGNYVWTLFDNKIKYAIDNRVKLNIATMCYYAQASNNITVGGATLSYPLYLHNQMQAESVKDWISTNEGAWIPDWNSNSYLTAWENLQKALAAHISAGSYKPSWSATAIPYSNAIGYVDIRGYGNFGEWHTSSWGTEAGALSRVATFATAKRIIDANLNAFPNNWATIGIAAFDQNTVQPDAWALKDPAIGYYALTAKNNKGEIAFRRDNWGWNQSWYDANLDKNNATYNGVAFKDLIMNKWKYAPIGGEPIQCCTTDNGTAGDYYYDLYREITLFHATYLGNGNLEAPTNAKTISRMQAAGAVMGYKLESKNDSVSSNLVPGGTMKVYTTWLNRGQAPVYEDWNVKYQLRNGSTVVWEGASAFVLKLFLPSTQKSTDTYTLPANIPTGTYSLYTKIVDPISYRLPLVLRMGGKTADTAYLLNSSVIIGNGTPPPPPINQPPTANAGSNQSITLPTSTVTLGGTGSDTDGTIAAYSWTVTSGPAGSTFGSSTLATTTVNGLVAGTYVFRLTVTDDKGATGYSEVTIVVNSAPPPPPPTQTYDVVIASFFGTIVSGVNRIAWTTSLESNGDLFYLERSSDNKNFSTINTQTVHNVQIGSTYSFDDATYTTQTNYYRLRVTKFDGTYFYSNTINIQRNRDGSGRKGRIRLYPNPTNSTLTLTYSVLRSDVNMQLMTTQSQLLRTYVLPTNSVSYQIDVSDLIAGTYYLYFVELNSMLKFVKM